MKVIIWNVFLMVVLISCKTKNATEETNLSGKFDVKEKVAFTIEDAEKLAELPLTCIVQEYPNKPGIVLGDSTDLQFPQHLHPAFYGCFDWHSSVHGHWSLVMLLKKFPDLKKSNEIRELLQQNLSKENIAKEIEYFKQPLNNSFERTYGWTWLLKLDLELLTWDDKLAKDLHQNLEPLSELIAEKYIDFLPKLNYPQRVGTHTNTAFGLRFAYEYAIETNNEKLKDIISSRAKAFYLNDENCPLSWEPSGTDFLSPCLEEANLMKYILPEKEFDQWLKKFMPEIYNTDFELKVGVVSDRTDGHLVHLDGLNFSRAWCLYHLAENKELKHLEKIANEHIKYSFPNLVGDDYMGGHWLASFALLALSSQITE